jgi:hypothetical protein
MSFCLFAQHKRKRKLRLVGCIKNLRSPNSLFVRLRFKDLSVRITFVVLVFVGNSLLKIFWGLVF